MHVVIVMHGLKSVPDDYHVHETKCQMVRNKMYNYY